MPRKRGHRRGSAPGGALRFEFDELAPGAVKRRGRKANLEAAEAAKLWRENERLRSQLEQAELSIAAQKKLAQALEQTLSHRDDAAS